jgi:hypothetical protein
MTAFLLARGASPQEPRTSTSAEDEAKLLGHWLAAEIISAWTKARGGRAPAGASGRSP